jgi:hypothetical protein
MQLGIWHVEVEGQVYDVTVVRGENGKDVVRVNGRVAAKPIAPDESERAVDVGGRMYIIRRQGADKFDLQGGDVSASMSPAALARELRKRDETIDAFAVLAGSNAPVAITPDSFFKRLPILGWLAIIGSIAGMMVYVAAGPSYDSVAKHRVKMILTDIHTSKGSSLGVKYWYNNNNFVDMPELMRASDGFDKWRQKKNLYRQIGEFKIVDTEAIKGEAIPTVIVHFEIEGNGYRVKVPKDLAITWAE